MKDTALLSGNSVTSGVVGVA